MNKTSFLECIFLFFIGCCACNSLTINSSSVKLPMDTLVDIVADCYFLEGEIYVKQWQYDVKDFASAKYDSLFKKRCISKETFVENIKYYLANEKYATQFMEKLDTLVEQRLSALRNSLDSEP